MGAESEGEGKKGGTVRTVERGDFMEGEPDWAEERADWQVGVRRGLLGVHINSSWLPSVTLSSSPYPPTTGTVTPACRGPGLHLAANPLLRTGRPLHWPHEASESTRAVPGLSSSGQSNQIRASGEAQHV